MYRHLLVPSDGSELSNKAVDVAVGLAKTLGARITGVYATPEFMPPLDTMVPAYSLPSREEYEKQAAVEADLALKALRDACASAGVSCECHYRINNHPYKVVLETAQARGCDLIVMASHGRGGLGALLLGSETQKVLTHGKLPVLVVR
jgi:nucleotide-binding universal stress UspA family protein